MIEVADQHPTNMEMADQAPSTPAFTGTFGMLAHRGTLVAFEVADTDVEIEERDGKLIVSGKLPKNGPENPGPTDTPTQDQRMHFYLDAKERQAAPMDEAAPRMTSASYSDVSQQQFWLARRLRLFEHWIASDEDIES